MAPSRRLLWKCDLAMMRLLRSRRFDAGAQRVLAEGYIGRWPLCLLMEGGIWKGLQRRVRRPPYPPFSGPRMFFPFLSARPVWPSNDHVSSILTSRWLEIRDELNALIKDAASSDNNTQSLTVQGAWKKVPLWSNGHAHRQNLDRCPATAAVLEQLPLCRALGMSYFSQILPGSVVRPHFGPTNARLRYHLGLVVPQGPRLEIADGSYQWSEGRTLVFSDAFVHAVRHEGKSARSVLIVDTYHPELTEYERQLLEDLEAVHRQFFPPSYEALPH